MVYTPESSYDAKTGTSVNKSAKLGKSNANTDRNMLPQSHLRKYFSDAEIRDHSHLKWWRTPLTLLTVWGTILGSVWLVFALWNQVPLYIYIPTVIALVCVVGHRQFSLSVLMHEGAHHLLFKSAKVNDFVSQWLCAYPIMSDTIPYRAYHIKHHAHTETDKDPDLVLSRAYPVNRASFFRKISRDVFGIAGVRRYYGQLRSVYQSTDKNTNVLVRTVQTINRLRGFFLTNAALFGLLWLFTGTVWAYPLMWWIPMLTYYSLIYRLRNIAEHAGVPNNSPFNTTRTTLSSVGKWFLAPLHVNYHLEHHLCQKIPWYNLPKFSRIAQQRLPQEQTCYARGYLQVFRDVVLDSNSQMAPQA